MKALLLGTWIWAIFGALSAVSAPVDDLGNLGFVTIGSPNNPADSNGCGRVGYSYRITKDPVDNQTYVRFLNAADPAGNNEKQLYNPKMMMSPEGGITFNSRSPEGRRYEVKPGDGRKPVSFVNWADAARFSNWLSNGAQRGSSTEMGAYNLRASKGGITERIKGSRYSVPTQNEIYKAAFYLPTGFGRSNSEQLYMNLSAGVLPSELGAISVPIVNGVVRELVDPYAVSNSKPQWTQNNEGEPKTFQFAGEEDFQAESGMVSFRLVSVEGEEYAERDDPEEYAGAPDLGGIGFFPSFPIPASGSGAGAPIGVATGSFDLPPSS